MSVKPTIEKAGGAVNKNRFRHDWRSIQIDVTEKIASGIWKPGDKLPNRRQLASDYGVAVATIERACASLVASGALTANARGTQVSDQGVDEADARRSQAGAGRQSGASSSNGNGLTNWTAQQYSSGAAETSPGTLGIISMHLPSDNEPAGSLDSWTFQVSRSLERSYLSGGGTTLFAALYSEQDDVVRPVEEAVNELRDQGALTIAVVELTQGLPVQEIQKLSDLRTWESNMLVYISDSEIETPIPHVYYDSPYLGKQAVQHLIRQGFKSFAYVSPYRLNWSLDRCEQARAAAISAGLGAQAVSPIFGNIVDPPTNRNHIEQQLDASLKFGQELFSRSDYPRCIIAANDYTAYGLIRASNERGLKQGADYAIVGFDDETRSIQYGLTTFRPPLEEIGTEAGLILTRLSHGERCETQVRLRSRLVARASTMRMDRIPA
ncbi:MAG: substrate-binding domain-containing protein [Capsulimonadaceae bacterium]|nr:substrate-binding domain-containing protein [Capsulimonadaceae bacterium]